MQCDIDIFGEPSNLAEIELILATTTTLSRLGFRNFQVMLNDRRLLKAMAAYSGFEQEKYDSVFITLDKMDKIGPEGVERELLANGFSQECVEKYLGLFKGLKGQSDGFSWLTRELGDFLEEDVERNLREIMESVTAAQDPDFTLVFAPTLVRGMSYYTGTIFEVAMPELGARCGGGGRYDKMVGKFTGNDVPACGFSIGFERIITILMDQGGHVPGEQPRKAYLVEKGLDAARFHEILRKAMAERKQGVQVLVSQMNKNKKFQKEQLGKEGYTEFVEFYRESLKE